METPRQVAASIKHELDRVEKKYMHLDSKLDKVLDFAKKGHLTPIWFIVYAALGVWLGTLI